MGVLWQNGSSAGCHTFVAIDPKTHRAFVMLADTANDGLDELASRLIDLIVADD